MKHALPGTISHGTLRTCDLLDAFASALEALQQRNLSTRDGDELRLTALNECVTDVLAAHESRPRMNRAEREEYEEELLQRMEDLLQEFAPPGHYFGAHPGDGADFGFWLHDDE